MISPKEVHKKATNRYFDFIESWFAGAEFFPLEIPANKKPEGDFAMLQSQINELMSQSKPTKKYSYRVELAQINTKKYGFQSLPTKIWFDTQTDLLRFVGKEAEFGALVKNIALIVAKIKALSEWAGANYKKVIKYQDVWPEIIEVCLYFVAHPKPNLYIRELPVNVHTKFVENHTAILTELLEMLITNDIDGDETVFEKRFYLKYAEPLVRFLVLDTDIAERFFSGIADISIPLKSFSALKIPVKRCIIVENKTSVYTFLTLPPAKNTIAIWGGGYNVATQKNIDWLHKCQILYWGDLDAQGFEILSQVRTYYPQTESVLMDLPTFEKYKHYVVDGTPSTIKQELNLTPAEKKLYNTLKTTTKRLEQEKIALDYAIDAIQYFMPFDKHECFF